MTLFRFKETTNQAFANLIGKEVLLSKVDGKLLVREASTKKSLLLTSPFSSAEHNYFATYGEPNFVVKTSNSVYGFETVRELQKDEKGLFYSQKQYVAWNRDNKEPQWREEDWQECDMSYYMSTCDCYDLKRKEREIKIYI